MATVSEMMKAILALEDGTVFEGFAFGACATTTGEVVFTTGMTGYQEVLTDPSYCGQIVTMTAPQIGNTGINREDDESTHGRPTVSGFVMRDPSLTTSNWRATEGLDEYLSRHGIVAIGGIDTRKLTRHLRDHGAQNGCIGSESAQPPLSASGICAGSTPARSANANASARVMTVALTTIWLTSFVVCPAPLGPIKVKREDR